MNVFELSQSFYCLYIKNREGKEQMFLQRDIAPESTRCRLDLFESEATAHRWIKAEQEIQALNERWGIHAIYDRLFTKKIYLTEFSELMKERDDIDSITLVTENGVRRLYFRSDFEYGFDTFPVSHQKLYPKEPIYIINRQKELDNKTILLNDTYFVTYPEVATPLFSVGIREWADDLISRRPDQGYYVEETTLYDLYMKTELQAKDPGFYIISRENAPHYILRKSDLKNIIEGNLDYQ